MKLRHAPPAPAPHTTRPYTASFSAAFSNEDTTGATVSARWAAIARDLIWWRWKLVVDDAANFSWGTIVIPGPPFAPTSGESDFVSGIAHDNSTNKGHTIGAVESTGNFLLYDLATGDFVSDTVPFTWANNDMLIIEGVYRTTIGTWPT